jgi:prevent-host-death family protein
MKVIGVRELRQNASRYLEEVAAGETIEITDRGRPVARLVPITGDPWQDLISAGEVVSAARPLSVDDIKPRAYRHSASKALEELRSNER